MRDLIMKLAPTEFTTYIEPFVGSGDIFLFMGLDPSVKAVINDLDPIISDSWKIIKSNPSIGTGDKYNKLTKEQINVRAEIDGTVEDSIKYISGSKEEIAQNLRGFRELRAEAPEGTGAGVVAREEPVVAIGDETASILDQEFSLSTKLDDFNEIVPEMKTMQKIADEENQTNLFIKRLEDCL